MEYIVSISSNEQPAKNIALAKEVLIKEFSNVKVASLIVTKPVGDDYPKCDFNNTVVSFTSRLDEHEMKDFLRKIENKLGRNPELREKKVVPVDIDIIIIGHEIVHRDYTRFAFLRRLVAEVRPVI